MPRKGRIRPFSQEEGGGGGGDSQVTMPEAPAPELGTPEGPVGSQGEQPPAAAAPTSQGPSAEQKTYSTVVGSLTLGDMQQRLAQAGYNGPTDPASIVSAFSRTARAPGATGAATGDFSQMDAAYQKLIDAAAQGNQQKFEEAKREFDLEYALKKQEASRSAVQFNLTHDQQAKSLQTDAAIRLLETASKLRGPADWNQYNTLLNGGRSVYQGLTGSTPTAAFGDIAGYNKPVDIHDILSQLGVIGGQQQGAAGQQQSGQQFNPNQAMQSWWNAQRAGGTTPTPEQWQDQFSRLTGAPPDQSEKAYGEASDYLTSRGAAMPADLFNQLAGQARYGLLAAARPGGQG